MYVFIDYAYVYNLWWLALPAERLQGVHKDTRLSTCNQKLARHPAHNICLLCLPCNTGNPNQNYQVHITNYRHANLLLVVGVIFAPQLSYFNSTSVFFTVCVIAGFSLFPCVLALNCDHKLTSNQNQRYFCFISP